jgi:arylformamidase
VIIDVSLPIGADMLTWPGDPPVAVHPRSRMSNGDSANVSEIVMGSHTGTHVDPPFHFIDGAPTIDEVPLDALVGDAVVVDLRGIGDEITPDHLQTLAAGTQRVLFRTDNSALWEQDHVEFPDSYTSLSLEAARWLVQRRVRLVGTDFLSIERKGAPGHPVHVALLEAGVVIVEGLNLSGVEPGAYALTCLPLRVKGGDGAPARALLSR